MWCQCFYPCRAFDEALSGRSSRALSPRRCFYPFHRPNHGYCRGCFLAVVLGLGFPRLRSLTRREWIVGYMFAMFFFKLCLVRFR